MSIKRLGKQPGMAVPEYRVGPGSRVRSGVLT